MNKQRGRGGNRKHGVRGFSETVFKQKTGKSLREWMKILDRFGARQKGHTASARYLLDSHGLSAWWSQAVTVRYEYDRGLRK